MMETQAVPVIRCPVCGSCHEVRPDNPVTCSCGHVKLIAEQNGKGTRPWAEYLNGYTLRRGDKVRIVGWQYPG